MAESVALGVVGCGVSKVVVFVIAIMILIIKRGDIRNFFDWNIN